MHELRYRQVHLDFHTSEKIPGIGAEFDADEFVQRLQRAHVNSVTLFSRCHHGWIYHETRFPNKHPHLTCDLLALQIEACHRHDIRCPIYITVGWDEYMARTHPEWLEVDVSGKRVGPPPLQPGWHKHCFASPYIDYVIEQTDEVLQRFGDEVDGIFFDIIFQNEVFSVWALQEFEQQGWDPADPKAQQAMRDLLVNRTKERLASAVRARNKRCTIFFNAGHINPSIRPSLHTYTHLELESLPSGGWGYAHFPITVRYARTLGLDCLGMTGKFAVSWGHFNSYKPKAALEYECFQMLALGAKCSIGDQLHPSGRLDPATYDLIGSVYSQVEEREEWCIGAKPVVEIGVFNVEAIQPQHVRIPPANLGAYRILQEGRHQFDFIDGESDWSRYRVVILPDEVALNNALTQKAQAYLDTGGALLCTGRSGLREDGSGFALSAFPAVYEGDLPYAPDFVRPFGALAEGVADTQYVMYLRGQKVSPAEGAEVLGEIWEPYFNRTYQHFCSHAHTPAARRSELPAALSKGRVVYLAHPVFSTFAQYGMTFYKQLVLNALKMLLPNPLVIADAPTTLQVTWNRQPEQNRSVVHLLHYIPERRTLAADYLEDVIPLYNVSLRLRTGAPKRAYLAPQREEIPFQTEGEYLCVTVPEVCGHQMVVLEE
ncbi:MAG: beta-galactosidase trimerization domain-containing protein [Armatimonadota bacterium]|nr:beta-galactosidase trimerization domain-containing protein [bacterium]MDW8322252.1 beta-galactosidase trimerization domain-containing protein [Armatimonadota bacterium]